ncbi:MAG TPA: MFS transporter [Candidatus Ornithoclostridium faecigallinarum]|nr:MFS transporter [Candidatus Ornithoclostridium faecigallinarum]
MRERTSTPLGGKIWASLLMCGFIGQVAWIVENMYFATFAQDIFENSPDANHLYYLVTTLMVVLSALTATVTTIFAGALTDKVGKRKPFISIGYIVWGVTIMLFATIDVDAAASNSTLVIALFVVFDCVMTLVGSTANDAAFNAWVTDVTDGTNRGKVNTILSVMPVVATVAAIAIAMFTYDKGNYAAFFIILGVIPIAAGVVSIFLVKDAPGIVRSDMRTAKDVFYGFRPSVVKSNKMMFVCLTALCLVGISQQTFFSYLINFVQTTLGITDYLLPIGAVIVLSAVITGVLGVFYDKLGRKKFYIPLAAFIVVGTLAIYLTKFLGEGAYLPMLYVGGTVMLGSLLCTNGALMSAFQDYIPDGCEGRFQGVRMCFTVLVPMVIGPVISMAIGINSFDPTDSGAIAPPFEIFLAAAIVAVIAIVPIVFVARDADRLRAAKAAQNSAERPTEHSENP